MVKLFLFPFTATVLLGAQVAPLEPNLRTSAAGISLQERLSSIRRHFPPDLLSGPLERGHRKTAYCISPNLSANSLSVKRCKQVTPQLLPALRLLRPGGGTVQ